MSLRRKVWTPEYSCGVEVEVQDIPGSSHGCCELRHEGACALGTLEGGREGDQPGEEGRCASSKGVFCSMCGLNSQQRPFTCDHKPASSELGVLAKKHWWLHVLG